MDIKEMEFSDRPAWDEYIRNSVHGLPFQLSGWRDILRDTYGFQAHYIMAIESGKVTGSLPVFIVRSALVGSRATTVQGGLCADSPETAAALIEEGKAAAARSGVKQLVIQDSHQAWSGEMTTTNNHVHWIIDIASRRECLWESLSRKVRYEIKKAQNHDLEAVVDYNGECLDDLYYVLSHFSHKAGAPFFARSFLECVTRSFPGGYHSILVYQDKRPLGAYFNLDLGSTTHGVWGSTLPEYLHLGAAYLAYWTVIRDASEHGFRSLDLGRSLARSKTSSFKSKWGGISEPIFQQFIDLKNGRHRSQSLTNQIQTSDKFQLFMKVWPKLPFGVVQYFGPKLRKHVPFA